MANRYAVIMAGGAGKRLWPASRANRPKQLIRLVDGKRLLDLAVERLGELFEPSRVLIITSAAYREAIRQSLPQLPPENVIGEPEGRDTANAIALAAELIAARQADATMAVFTADHIIRPEGDFRRCVEKAMQTAEGEPDALVTFGIRPSSPHTGLGYIHTAPARPDGIRPVLGFKEKPDHHTARMYVESGQYFWNSGMFVWKVETILATLRELLPASAHALAEVGAAARAGRPIAPLLERIYPALARISIDYAVMEKAQNVLMVELACQWLDVGSWPSLETVIPLDADGNAVVAARAAVIDSNRNILYSDDDEHLLAVVGMDDCIIVHARDATLVCNKSDAQRLKELVDLIARQYGQRYV